MTTMREEYPLGLELVTSDGLPIMAADVVRIDPITGVTGTTLQAALESIQSASSPIETLSSLPATVEHGKLIIVGADLYVGVNATSFPMVLTRGDDGVEFGFYRGRFGSISPDYEWVDAIFWNQNEQESTVHIRYSSAISTVTVGSTRFVSIAQSGLTNDYTELGGGRQALQSTTGVTSNPFPAGESTHTLTLIHPSAGIAEWARVGHSLEEIEQLIAVHAGMPNIHHHPPAGGGTGGYQPRQSLLATPFTVTVTGTDENVNRMYAIPAEYHYDIDNSDMNIRFLTNSSLGGDESVNLTYEFNNAQGNQIGVPQTLTIRDEVGDSGAILVPMATRSIYLDNITLAADGDTIEFTGLNLERLPIPTDITQGLNQSQVDARIAARVQDFAETGNTDDFPVTRIPADIARTSQIPTLSNDTPVQSGTTTGSAGTSAEVSRSDHRHQGDGVGSGGGNGDGLSQAAVDDRIEAYTGQMEDTPTGTFARDRIPLATATQPGGVTAADQAKSERYPDPKDSSPGQILKVNDAAAGSREFEIVDDFQLPEALADLGADYEAATWLFQPNAVAQIVQSKPTLSQMAGFTYANAQQESFRRTNYWAPIRLTASTSLTDMRRQLRVGENSTSVAPFARFDSNDWELVGTQGGFDYYLVELPDHPAADYIFVVVDEPAQLRNVRIDYSQLENVPAETGVPFTQPEKTKLAGLENYVLPETLGDLGADYEAASWEYEPLAVADIVQNKPTLTQMAGFTYGNSQQESFRRVNYWAPIRLETGTPLDDMRRQLRVGEDSLTIAPFARFDSNDWELVGTSGNYDYYLVQVPDHPAADYIFVVVDEPVRLRNVHVDWDQVIDKTDQIIPSELSAVPGTRLGGRFLKYSDDLTAFDAVELVGQREVFAGTGPGMNLSVNSVDGNSATTPVALDEVVDLDEEGHGLIGGSFTFTLSERSANTLSFAPTASAADAVTSITLTGFVSLESIDSTADYGPSLTPPQVGTVLVSANLYNGMALRGEALIRIHHDGNNALAINGQYLADAGPTDTATAAISTNGNLILLASGAPRGNAGTGEPIFQFATAVPTTNLDLYPDGSLAIVWSGANIGLYRKDTVIVHNQADTGLGGEDVEPTGSGRNLSAPTADGRYTHLYWARAAFTNRGSTQLTASPSSGAGSWSEAPATLTYLDFNYRTTTRSDGEITLRYSANRTYTGSIRITAGTLTLDLIKQGDNRTWLLRGISAAQIATLRENTWRLSEPGQTPTSSTSSWTQLLPRSGGTAVTLSDNIPTPSTTAAGSAGTSAEVSRSDHRHQAPSSGGGGTLTAGTVTRDTLGTAVVLEFPSNGWEWGDWTDLFSKTIAATEVGLVAYDFTAHADGSNSTPGNNRVFLEYRVQRTRSSAMTEVTHVSATARNFTAGTQDANRRSAHVYSALSYHDIAVAGDIVKLQVRIMNQLGQSPAENVANASVTWAADGDTYFDFITFPKTG